MDSGGPSLTHPYWVFTEHGYEIDIVSPDGGALQADSWSDPSDESGYSAHDLISMGFINSPNHSKLVEDTPAINSVDIDKYDAIFLVGGQSPMVTFYETNPFIPLLLSFMKQARWYPLCATLPACY